MEESKMSQQIEFHGFSKETISFFRGLKRNNTRPWFEAHREMYEKHVLEPSKAFVVALGTRLKQISPRIIAAPKINRSLFRLNRDTRFSPDKSPYKPNLGIFFWEGTRSRMECPGFYFHIEPPILLLAGGMYMFPNWLMDRYRHAVVHPRYGRELTKIVGAIRRGEEFELGAKHYKRIPSGFPSSHPNAEFLLYNSLHAGWETDIPEELFTPRLVEYCYEKFALLAPLHRWLVALIEGRMH
jgi:uncharacterized protein (TIGR02453 family)